MIFYFDLGSPYAYLASERVPEAAAWQPVLLGAIFKLRGHGSWTLTEARAEGMAEVERRAAAYGLPALVWPDPFPANTLLAMRCAVAGGREFARAAFRAAFQRGADLGDPDVLRALSAPAVTDAVKDELRRATDHAWRAGVPGVPSFGVGERIFYGDDQLDAAASASRRTGL